MKSITLLADLFERLLDWITGGRLGELAKRNQELFDLRTALLDSKRNESHMRAQLMQLRVENSDPSPMARIGWQVSAFIPQSVVDRLAKTDPVVKEKFVATVATKLVDGAIAGIFKINSKGGTTALVFEPMSTDSSKRVLSCWFEGDTRRPGYIAPESQIERLQRLIDGSPEYKSLFRELLPPEHH